MRISPCVAAALALVGCRQCGLQSEFVLAERDRASQAVIVVPADPSPVVQFAAEQLRDYTARLTDVVLPIETNTTPAHAIHLGCRDDGIRRDGFRITVTNGALRVASSLDRGTLYGVYEILETYGGVGWYASWCEIVPKADRLAVPAGLDVLSEPSFDMREPFFFDPNRNPLFASRLRRNSTRYRRNTADPRYALDNFPVGENMQAHTFQVLVPPEKYFDAHPEYFSFFGGKRQKNRSQLCCSNPDLVRLVVTNFMECVRTGRPAFVYSISHNDWKGWCECPDCKARDDYEGSHAAGELVLANACAEALAKEFPERRIRSCGYEWTQTPPKHMKVHPNVIVTLCSITCDFSEPIRDASCSRNAAFMKDLKGWASRAERLQITDYPPNFSDYIGPHGNIHVLQPNLQCFRDNKVRDLFLLASHCGQHADFAELKAWLMSKLAWDVDQPVEPLLRRFCEGYYGPEAAPFVLDYLNRLCAAARRRDHENDPLLTIHMPTEYDAALSEDFLREGLALWNRAEEAVPADDALRRYNVRTGKMSVVAALLRRKSPLICADGIGPSDEAKGWARWMLESLDLIARTHGKEKGRVAFWENGTSDPLRHAWQRIIEPDGKSSWTIREIEDVMSVRERFGASVKSDATASGGRAVCLSAAHSGTWALVMRASRVQKTAGRKYRVRVKARVERTAGAPDGEVLFGGIGSRGLAEKAWRASDMTDAYRWYELGVWTAEAEDPPKREVYFGPGHSPKGFKEKNDAFDSVWIDCIEIVPCE